MLRKSLINISCYLCHKVEGNSFLQSYEEIKVQFHKMESENLVYQDLPKFGNQRLQYFMTLSFTLLKLFLKMGTIDLTDNNATILNTLVDIYQGIGSFSV